jgi:uncharacterized protein (DUF1501 family)
VKRRDFLRLCALLGANAFMPLNLYGNNFSDYKALVIVLLHGGNDSLNMFVPTSNDQFSGYNAYKKARGVLAIEQNFLDLPIINNKLELSAGEQNPYYSNGTITKAYTKGLYNTPYNIGVNPLMPELAYLIKNNKVAIISNMGMLHQPTTKQDIIDKKVTLPIFLYSHNSQRALFYTGDSQNQSKIGWAGHLADIWQNINNSNVYKLNIAINKSTKIFFGKNSNPLVISQNGPSKYSKVKNQERQMYEELLNINYQNKFLRLYNEIKSKSFTFQDILQNDWQIDFTLNSTNAYNKPLFSKLDSATLGVKNSENIGSSLIDQLKAVAKLIKIGKEKGLKREIFFVTHAKYDTHGNQTFQHARNLRELSIAINDFYLAMQELNLENSVTLFNISDFGRSAGNNGDGSDHAWGGHYFVIGGAVKGGLYGKLPSLELGGIDDATKKGRLIPKISHTQYYSTLLKWFGVDDNTLLNLFPELKNFEQKDLGFLRS